MNQNLKDLSAGLRPALLFKSIGLSFESLNIKLFELSERGLIKDHTGLFKSIVEQLIDILDELWSPIIAFEIGKRYSGTQIKDPSLAYIKFFLDEEGHWKDETLQIFIRNKFQANIIRNLAYNVYNFILEFFDIYSNDAGHIAKYFGIQASIIALDLGASDTHNHGRFSLIVTFSNKKKLIFKPKSPANDLFIKEYCDLLNLETSLIPSLPSLICSSEDHFWSEYIEYQKYSSNDDLEKFYINAGSVLAVMDSLNFSDGHHENFVSAPTQKLCLVDAETILINLSYFDGRLDSFYDLSFTGMIESKQRDKSYISALQANEDFFSYPVTPTVMHDLTSNLRIVYNTIKKNIYAKSSPIEKNKKISDFSEHVKLGAHQTYKRIALIPYKELEDLLRKYSNQLKLRQIKRHTLYYQWLLHRMAHPMNGDVGNFIASSMRNYPDQIVDYEMDCLINGDIPIFYHKPFSRHLYGSDDRLVIEDYFSKTAAEWFEKKSIDIHNKDFLCARMEQISQLLLDEA